MGALLVERSEAGTEKGPGHSGEAGLLPGGGG